MGPLSDRDAVERVAASYIEAWFNADADTMRACLHPKLAKRAIEDAGSGSADLDVISAEEMCAATAAGRGKRYPPGHEVQVFDIDGDLATVKVTSVPYVEYLHLARFGDRWWIINVLWRRRNGNVPAG